MNQWLANEVGGGAATFITSVVVLLVIIAAVYFIFKVRQRIQRSSYIIGKKARTPRLSVCDAAAIDRTRRLVLIKRDEVEHLILIGGPTDIVIETNISIDHTDLDVTENLTQKERLSSATTKQSSLLDEQRPTQKIGDPYLEELIGDRKKRSTDRVARADYMPTDGDLSNVVAANVSQISVVEGRRRSATRREPSIDLDERAKENTTFDDFFETTILQK